MGDDLYTIATAAEKAGVSVGTVRNYCRLGLVTPLRDSSNRRLFRPSDVKAIRAAFLDNINRWQCPAFAG